MKAQIDSMISIFNELDSQQRHSIIYGSPSVSIEARLYLYSKVFHLSNCSPSIVPLLVEVIPTISVTPLIKLAEEYFTRTPQQLNSSTPQPLNLSHLSSCIISYLKWNMMLFSPMYSLISNRGNHPISSMLSSLGDYLCVYITPITESLKSEIVAEPPYDFLELLQGMSFTKMTFSNGKFEYQSTKQVNQLRRPIPTLVEKIKRSIEADKKMIHFLFEKHLVIPEEVPFSEKLEMISLFLQRWRGVFSGVIFESKKAEISLEISNRFTQALHRLEEGDSKSLLELRGEPLAVFADWLRSDLEGNARARVQALVFSAAKSIFKGNNLGDFNTKSQFILSRAPLSPQELLALEEFITKLLKIIEIRDSLFFGEKNEDFSASVSFELGMVPAFNSQLCRFVDHLLRRGNSKMNYLVPLELVRFLPSKSEFMIEYEYWFMVRNLCCFEEIKLDEEKQIANLLSTICTEGETDKLMGLIHDLERLNSSTPQSHPIQYYTFRPLYFPHWQSLIDQLPLHGLEPLNPPYNSPLSSLINHSLNVSSSFLSSHKAGELSLGLTTVEIIFNNGVSLKAPLFVIQFIEAISTNEGSQPSHLASLFAEKGRHLVPKIIEVLLENELVIASENGVFLHPKMGSPLKDSEDIAAIEIPLSCFISPPATALESKTYTYDTRIIKAKIVWILKQKKQILQNDIEQIIREEYREEGPLAIKQILVDLIDDQVIFRDKNDPNILILS